MTREKAIEILKEIIDEGWLISDFEKCVAIDACEMAIEALKQEPRKDEVILTKKEYGELVSSEFENGYAKGYREAMEEQEICEDAVSRKAIVEMLNARGQGSVMTFDHFIELLYKLPPVTPTRKKAKWICVHHIENKITYDSWKCSECQHDFNSEEESMVYFNEYKYCPNCGAEMESEQLLSYADQDTMQPAT